MMGAEEKCTRCELKRKKKNQIEEQGVDYFIFLLLQ
jgi:hypothetical protein